MACVNVPLIVAEGSFLDQTSDLSSTPVYSVSTAGLFRINLQGTETTGDVQIDLGVTWTDENGSQAQQVSLILPPPNAASLSLPAVIYCAASSSISISATVNATPPFGDVAYNVRYVVESL